MNFSQLLDYINRKLPDRTKASDPMYKAEVVRDVLFKVAGASPWKALDGYPATNPDDPALRGGLTLIGTSEVDTSGALFQVGSTPAKGGIMMALINRVAKTAINAGAFIRYGQKDADFWDVGLATDKAFAFRAWDGTRIVDRVRFATDGTVSLTGLAASGGKPVAIALSGLGGGSAALDAGATDLAGQISITTGANPANVGFARITFSQALAARPRMVVLTPASQSAAQYYSCFVLYVDSSASVTLYSSGATVPPANTTYSFNYLIIQ